MKTLVIIPSRMASKRFPNKPLALIDDIPMIQRVWEQAKKSNVGEVYVACSEKEVFDLITNQGGNAIMTDPNLPSGTDRVYAALKKIEKNNDFESVINLQGDMPLIDPEHIKKVNEPIKYGYLMGTLSTNLSLDEEKNINITKVKIKWEKNNNIGEAIDFYKNSKNNITNVYHHVGIYSFNLSCLKKFVNLEPSKNELNLNLEQLRAIDAGIKIGITYVEDVPISIDTKDDLINIQNIIKRSDD